MGAFADLIVLAILADFTTVEFVAILADAVLFTDATFGLLLTCHGGNGCPGGSVGDVTLVAVAAVVVIGAKGYDCGCPIGD